MCPKRQPRAGLRSGGERAARSAVCQTAPGLSLGLRLQLVCVVKSPRAGVALIQALRKKIFFQGPPRTVAGPPAESVGGRQPGGGASVVWHLGQTVRLGLTSNGSGRGEAALPGAEKGELAVRRNRPNGPGPEPARGPAMASLVSPSTRHQDRTLRNHNFDLSHFPKTRFL